MKNETFWKESKYSTKSNGQLTSGPSVHPASSIMVHIQAEPYAQLIRNHAHGHLLDLGCGSVPLFGSYRQHVEKVTCVDWAEGLHDQTHVDLAMDLNGPLDFPDETFDTVLISDVLEHIGEPAGLLREINRILKPDGKLIGGVPFLYWIHEAPHDYFRYTKFGLERLFANAGFSCILVEPLGGLPDVIADTISKATLATPRIQRAIVRLMARVLRTRLAGKARFRTSKTCPIAYAFSCEADKG